jgi:hypothetical protein
LWDEVVPAMDPEEGTPRNFMHGLMRLTMSGKINELLLTAIVNLSWSI